MLPFEVQGLRILLSVFLVVVAPASVLHQRIPAHIRLQSLWLQLPLRGFPQQVLVLRGGARRDAGVIEGIEESNATIETDISGDGGVLMRQIVAGSGNLCLQSAVFIFCHVRASYIAVDAASRKMLPFFDSRAASTEGSAKGRGVPVHLMLSDGGSVLETSLEIKALGMAVKKMRVGERVQVRSSSAYAFSSTGRNASGAGWIADGVPPNVSIALDIELLRFGHENVMRDAFGSILVTYLRHWPLLPAYTEPGISQSTPQPATPTSSTTGPSNGAEGGQWGGTWSRQRRGSGWRTAFSGGEYYILYICITYALLYIYMY